MKKTLFTTALSICITVNMALAQWNGNTSTTNLDIYREGSVGIGTTTTPAAKLELNFFNGSGSIPQYGLLLNTNSFGTSTNADNSYYLKTLDQGNGVVSFIIKGNGNVGIGTQTPTAPLTVSTGGTIMSLFKHNGTANCAITVANNTGQMNLGVGATTPHPYIWSNTGKFFIGDDGNPTMFIGMGNGNVGIGTDNPGSFKLAVEGKIGARGVKVTLANPFPDYVFDPNYQLTPLSNLQKYIDQNKHLPGIPSAEEVKKDGGIELGEMNVKLLEKVEELTLYMIELKKENEQMKKAIAELNQKK